jgi:hypothetical protein
MTVAAPSILMDELVELVKAALGTNNVQYGPPEGVPASDLVWVRFGERPYIYSTFTTETVQVFIEVAVPSNGDYAGEYRIVNDLTNRIAMALLPSALGRQPLIVGELVATGMTVREPGRAAFAGQDGAIMAGLIELSFDSKDMNL